MSGSRMFLNSANVCSGSIGPTIVCSRLVYEDQLVASGFESDTEVACTPSPHPSIQPTFAVSTAMHVSPAHPAHPSIHPAHPCSPSIPSIQPSPVQPVRHARHRTMRTIVPFVSCCAIIRAIVNRPCIARIAANVFEQTCLLAEPSLTSMITRVLKGANLNAIC